MAWASTGRTEDDESAREAEEITVRGSSAAGFVSRARIEDAPREVTDAASLLEPMPGVHVRRLGADDSFSTLSIRGTSSTQVAVFLAGVPLSGGADPTLDLATLPLWPGARARVYRSFAPASLGPGSLGGSLVLDAPSPRDAQRTEVWGAVGSFGSRRVRLGDVRALPGGVRVATGVSASRSEDDFSFLDERATSTAGHDVFATRRNAAHATASGLVAVSIPFSLSAARLDTKNASDARAGTLTIVTLAQARRQELPGSVTAPTPDQRLDSNRIVGAVELALPVDLGTVAFRGWGRREGLALDDSVQNARVSFGPIATSDSIVAVGGSVAFRARTERATFEGRVDASGERFAPGTWIGAAQPAGARRTSAGAGVDGTVRVARPLTLSISGRADGWVDTSNDTRDGGGAEPSSRELRPTGNVGGELRLGALSIATHGGLLARPPSFVERYGNRGFFLGDRALRPESATTLDLGATLEKKFGRLRASIMAAGFVTWAEDLIVFVPSGAYGRAKATNIGRARLLGTEAEARVSAFGFDVRLSHTALATANESECRFVDGTCERPALPGRPAHDFVGDMTYRAGIVRVRYGVDVVAGMTADATGATVVPDRVLHGAGLRVEIPPLPGLSLSLDVRNVFDLRVAEYRGITGPVRAPIGDALDYPIPGRHVLFAARWAFPDAEPSASVRAPK